MTPSCSSGDKGIADIPRADFNDIIFALGGYWLKCMCGAPIYSSSSTFTAQCYKCGLEHNMSLKPRGRVTKYTPDGVYEGDEGDEGYGYAGQLDNGQRHAGKLTLLTGEVYSGGWHSGQRHGAGIFVHADGRRELHKYDMGVLQSAVVLPSNMAHIGDMVKPAVIDPTVKKHMQAMRAMRQMDRGPLPYATRAAKKRMQQQAMGPSANTRAAKKRK